MEILIEQLIPTSQLKKPPVSVEIRWLFPLLGVGVRVIKP